MVFRYVQVRWHKKPGANANSLPGLLIPKRLHVHAHQTDIVQEAAFTSRGLILESLESNRYNSDTFGVLGEYLCVNLTLKITCIHERDQQFERPPCVGNFTCFI